MQFSLAVLEEFDRDQQLPLFDFSIADGDFLFQLEHRSLLVRFIEFHQREDPTTTKYLIRIIARYIHTAALPPLIDDRNDTIRHLFVMLLHANLRMRNLCYYFETLGNVPEEYIDIIASVMVEDDYLNYLILVNRLGMSGERLVYALNKLQEPYEFEYAYYFLDDAASWTDDEYYNTAMTVLSKVQLAPVEDHRLLIDLIRPVQQSALNLYLFNRFPNLRSYEETRLVRRYMDDNDIPMDLMYNITKFL